MAKLSWLPDELLVKILTYLPTKVAVSTSVLSKQWEFIWTWLPKLEFDDYNDIAHTNRSESSLLRYRDFIKKNLPLHKAPVIDSLRLRFGCVSLQPEDTKLWVGISVSRVLRELSITYHFWDDSPQVLLPCSLYSCESLVTLKLEGKNVLVDVPETACLTSLKALQLRYVTYLNQDSLRLLLSYCHVLEDLRIEREYKDNVKALVVDVPSLQCLYLIMNSGCSGHGYVIVTPSLKYLNVVDTRYTPSYFIAPMPELEEADISVRRDPEKLLVSITSVKRLSLQVEINSMQEPEPVYHPGIVFNHLEHMKVYISNDHWSKLLVRLLKDSPNLRELTLYASSKPYCMNYQTGSWNNSESSVPECLLKSLETFKFEGIIGRPEERDFSRFISRHARCLKS